MIIRKYEDLDIFKIEVRDEQAYVKDSAHIQQYNTLFNKTHSIKTVEIDSKVVFIGGLIRLYGNVAEGFFLTSKDLLNEFKGYWLKIIRHMIEEIEFSEYTRIQTLVQSDFEQGIRFIEFLEFKQEGLLRKIGMDPKQSDCYIYAYIKE